jgi:hypothetical protein
MIYVGEAKRGIFKRRMRVAMGLGVTMQEPILEI